MLRNCAFGSDNFAPMHPLIMRAMVDANEGFVVAYGWDQYTSAAKHLFKEQFGPDIEVHFVLNGTGANVLSMKSLLKSYEAVIATEIAHVHVHECGGIENSVGAKNLLVPTADGKLTVEKIEH